MGETDLYGDDALGAIAAGLPGDYFPAIADRRTWERIRASDAERVIAPAEALLATEWPVLPVVRYADYARNGDRTRYQECYFGRRSRLIVNLLAEALENRGRFVDEIITGSWAICEETSWTVPAHNNGHRDGKARVLPDGAEPIVDLFAAETGSLLSAVVRMAGPQLAAFSPMIAERVRTEVERRVIEPFLERDDFWWMGTGEREVNNWNPWIVSNVLSSLYALRPPAELAARVARKSLWCLSRFLDVYAEDGGCDEGASYWGHAAGSLFDAADLLRHMTGGRIDLLSIPKVREMGRYLYRVHIDRAWFVNYADGAAWNDKASPQLIYRYGRAIGDERLAALGVELSGVLTPEVADVGSDRYAIRAIWSLVFAEELRGSSLAYTPLPDSWTPGIAVITGRAGKSPEFFFSAKGGDNHESHNHNDVGNFILFCDGAPVVVDAGVETYTAKTFSDDRYSIWTMRSLYHNLPIINGCEQISDSREAPHPAEDVEAQIDAEAVRFSLDIAPAYPPEAGMTSWHRTFVLQRTATPKLTVTETPRATSYPASVELVFLTVAEPEITASGCRLAAGETTVELVVRPGPNARAGEPRAERISTEDARLARVWGPTLYRLVIPLDLDGPEAQVVSTFSPV